MKSSSIIKTRSLDLLQGCAVGFLSALLSNARVLGSFSPFGISFAAATPKEYSLFALAGSACGYVIFGGITDKMCIRDRHRGDFPQLSCYLQ